MTIELTKMEFQLDILAHEDHETCYELMARFQRSTSDIDLLCIYFQARQ